MKRPYLLLLSMAGLMTQTMSAQAVKPYVSASPEKPTAPVMSNATPAVADAKYVIGADDVLQITVWKEASLSGSLPVRPDGMVSLVLIGDLPAAGKTPMQLATDIEEKLKKYIQDPNVTVAVTAVNSHRVFIVGEVQHVGPVTLSAGMTPLQAIAAAGGLTPYANKKHIYILRSDNGKQQKIPFDYKSALKGDAGLVALKTGDTVVVP